MSESSGDLLSIFWVEAAEYLDGLNQILLQLEVAQPGDEHTDAVRELSRIAHSLKGAARAVGQTKIEMLAHQMEEVFDAALAGSLSLEPAVCDALYDALDVIQVMVNGDRAMPDTVALVLQQLGELTGHKSVLDAKRQTLLIEPQVEPEAGPRAEDTVRVNLSKLEQLMGQASELLVARMHSEQRRYDLQALLQEHRRWQRVWRHVRSAYVRTVRRLRDKPNNFDGSADLLSLLEFLEDTQHYMNQSGLAMRALNHALAQDNLHLATLVDELQADIASVRMLPFATILGAFQRMVRDLAREGGKEVALEVQGAEVELDKHVLEMLKDPLTHLLRNAVDHGIETPTERMAAGKSPAGTVTVRVSSRGSDIHVAVEDDGRGVDPQAVRRKALEKGLISESEVEALTLDESAALIFEPGFSTASQVTAVSGRGVGLDVVKRRVEALRGRLWLENRPGHGAAFHLIVPVSLTRIRCLLARVNREAYAIPLTAVTRIVNVTPEELFYVDNRPMIEVMGRPMPLVHLAEALERPGTPAPLTANTPILVLHSTERAVAFAVDELLSERELVLKKLGEELSRIRNVAGAAILGTGEVVIVLNTSDLIKSARRVRGRVSVAEAAPAALPPEPARQPWVLVVDDSLTTRTLEKNILEAAGYRVHTVTDGAQALEALLDRPCDVIVADVEMPNMNGLELARRVKSDARWRHIPVILVTSRDSSGDREEGLRAGADAYLVKTRFDQDELLQVIEQMI